MVSIDDRGFLFQLIMNTWQLVAEMAPYLMFGFLAAGLLQLFFKSDFIQQHLGKPGMGSVLKASVLGVPMPTLLLLRHPSRSDPSKKWSHPRRNGIFPHFDARKPASTASLLPSLYSEGFSPLSRDRRLRLRDRLRLPHRTLLQEPPKPPQPSMAGLNFEPIAPQKPKVTSNCCKIKKTPDWRSGLRYAFITLPSDLASALIIGLILAGLITTALPSDVLNDSPLLWPPCLCLRNNHQSPTLCLRDSIHSDGLCLDRSRLVPGAALVFLIAGQRPTQRPWLRSGKCWGEHRRDLPSKPANHRLALRRTLRQFPPRRNHKHQPLHHEHTSTIPIWKHLSGGVARTLLLANLIAGIRQKKKTKPCCCG